MSAILSTNAPVLAVIVGPTASGKSALALELARKQASIIINADSAQVYRDLPVLSAQPSEEEKNTVEHRLYGFLEGQETCSAGRWADAARAEISQAHQNGKLPILVGGTGLYIRSVLDGIAPVPPINPDIRAEIRRLDVSTAYTRLGALDPATAARLNPADSSRIMRALEVISSTGKSLLHWQQQKTGGIGDKLSLHPIVLLPDRQWLYQRCDQRFDQMLENGAIEEVERLLTTGLPADAPVLRAIGVPEIRAFLHGSISRLEMAERGKMATRRYAKRQYTWFRNQCPQEWRRVDNAINCNLYDFFDI